MAAAISPATDNASPTATINSPVDGANYTLGQVVNADYTCDDDVAVATCIGPVANGDPIDTSTAGTHTFTVDATDSSAKTGSATATYHVGYPFEWAGGIVAKPGVNNATAGDNLIVTFSLGGPQGLGAIHNLPRHRRVNCDTDKPLSRAVYGRVSLPVWDVKLGLYRFTWRTNAAWAGTCRRLIVRLNDGTRYSAIFHFDAPPTAVLPEP